MRPRRSTGRALILRGVWRLPVRSRRGSWLSGFEGAHLVDEAGAFVVGEWYLERGEPFVQLALLERSVLGRLARGADGERLVGDRDVAVCLVLADHQAGREVRARVGA